MAQRERHVREHHQVADQNREHVRAALAVELVLDRALYSRVQQAAPFNPHLSPTTRVRIIFNKIPSHLKLIIISVISAAREYHYQCTDTSTSEFQEMVMLGCEKFFINLIYSASHAIAIFICFESGSGELLMTIVIIRAACSQEVICGSYYSLRHI